MVKCPFCSFDNEDGALFCEQCKSDLGAVPAPAVAAAETMPMAALVESMAPMGAVVETAPAAGVPMAAVVDTASAPTEMPSTPPAEEQAAPTGASLPAGAAPKLEVIRGQKIKMEFPIYPDLNFIGRSDDKPVDIDLEDQEPPDRVWCSRQHAVIHFDEAQSIITVEDLNSSNGTFVNRVRVHPGLKRQLFVNDVIQIGTVHLKLKV